MWYKEKYRIVTENPYNKEKLNGLGLVIYSEWKDSFVNIMEKPRDFDPLATQDCPLWLQYD